MAVADDNWTRLHGTRGIGVADGKLPNQWQPSDYRWQVDLLGDDAGSATVFGDRVFVASSDSTALRRLSCIQLSTGKVMWEHDFPSPTSHLHRRNAYATCTPTCDAQHVYFAYANDEQTILVCMTHEGRQVWQRDLGRWVSQHGFGTSPALVDELVVLFKSQQAAKLAPGVQPGQSKMIAMHRETGKTVWETPLQATNVCYGIPAVHRAADGTTQIIAANTGNGMFGLNAADGTMMWSVPAFDKRCVSCPLIVQTRGNTLVLATTGSGGGGNRLAAVRPGVSGRDAELVYEINKSVGYVPTSAVLYSPTDSTRPYILTCQRIAARRNSTIGNHEQQGRAIGG
ncbi:MAG: PQQ-binding-like beta-propeller repeat protein, partial [Planctomycetota bacterium]